MTVVASHGPPSPGDRDAAVLAARRRRPTHLLRLAESLVAAGPSADGRYAAVEADRGREQMMIGPVPLVRLRGRRAAAGARCGGCIRWRAGCAEQHARWRARRWAAARGVRGARRSAAARDLPRVLIAGEDDLAWQQTATLGSRIAARCREARAHCRPSQPARRRALPRGFANRLRHVIPRRVPSPPLRSANRARCRRAALAAVNYDLVTDRPMPGRLGDRTAGCGASLWRSRSRLANRHRPPAGARLWIVGDGPEREAALSADWRSRSTVSRAVARHVRLPGRTAPGQRHAAGSRAAFRAAVACWMPGGGPAVLPRVASALGECSSRPRTNGLALSAGRFQSPGRRRLAS